MITYKYIDTSAIIERSLEMKALTEHQLKSLSNLVVIPEVFEEFRFGVDASCEGLQHISPKLLADPVKQAVPSYDRQLRILNILRNGKDLYEHLNITPLPEIKQNEIQQAFMGQGGKTNERQTDTKLILAALAHAKTAPVVLITNDSAIISTFRHYTRCFGETINPTRILTVSGGEYCLINPTLSKTKLAQQLAYHQTARTPEPQTA